MDSDSNGGERTDADSHFYKHAGTNNNLNARPARSYLNAGGLSSPICDTNTDSILNEHVYLPNCTD